MIVPAVAHIDLRDPAEQFGIVVSVLLSQHLPHRFCDEEEPLDACLELFNAVGGNASSSTGTWSTLATSKVWRKGVHARSMAPPIPAVRAYSALG
jgi:hypothetical protein